LNRTRSNPRILACLIALLAAVFLAACSQGSEMDLLTITPTPIENTPRPSGHLTTDSCPPASAANDLTGAGATFPEPLYSDWFIRWNDLCGVQVNYGAIGSGGGIQQISSKTVDFGASDAIMTPDEKAAAPAPIHAIPMTSDAVAVIYNQNLIENQTMALDGPTLADIYLGKITKWNDPKIKTLNPNIFLPDDDITVVHRSDGSGTSAIFTNYLSQVSPEWKSEVGTATAVNWPVGLGGSGNSGVAGQVSQLPNSIGYVSLAFAKQNHISYIKMINKAGKTISPSIESARAAQVGVEIPDNTEVLITDSPNADAYPITGFTWLLLYVEQEDRAKSISLAALVKWMLTDAQQFCEGLDYVPLSDEVVQKGLAELENTTFQGTPITQLQ
jgi:phosphate transport system substrate-binding protein